jgi:hypothetical protein
MGGYASPDASTPMVKLIARASGKGMSYQNRRAGAPVRVERRVPIIVQNLPAPFERVRPARQALISAERSAGLRDNARQIWQLLTMELWYRNVRSMGVAA